MKIYCVCGESINLYRLADTSCKCRSKLLKLRYQFIKEHRPCREREPQLEKDDG